MSGGDAAADHPRPDARGAGAPAGDSPATGAPVEGARAESPSAGDAPAGVTPAGGAAAEGALAESAPAAVAELLRAAARELADIGTAVQEASVHATAALTDGAVLGALPRAPAEGYRAQRALLRAVTDRNGLGYAVAGGRLGALAAKLGGMAGAESLAVLILATSLRLRITAVTLNHPELLDDPLLSRLIGAVGADRDIESVRALRALLKDRGAVRTLSGLAPVFGEVLALRALLDENPLNDTAAWLIATGKGYASADPITGLSNRAIAVLDTGDGAARRLEPDPAEAARLGSRGSLLDFLANIGVVGTTGRMLIQSVTGPDGVVRHVVQVPGMRPGRPDTDSPQDLLGAFSSAVLDSGPYSRALIKAIDDFGIPPGAEIALIGHSSGGAAIMNLVQDTGFCARYTVTHAVAVGSPVDFKRPADPRTWIASVTNQHDIIPTLDGQGAGNCFDLHPDWYVVDYFDSTHLFPICHSIEHYAANIANDLPEARDRIDRQLTPYRGPVTRSQIYLLFDRAPHPEGFPFLTVPTYPATTSRGALELPVRCQDGSALTAYFAADPGVAAALLEETGLGPAVRIAGRALVALHASWDRRTSLGGYREVDLGIIVHDPWRPRPFRIWPDLLRRADRRHSGSCSVGSVVDADTVSAVAPEIWGRRPSVAPLDIRLTARSARIVVGGPDDRLLTLRGPLGPGVPIEGRDLVSYSRHGGTTLRSCVETRGRGRAHPAPRARLTVGRTAHPMARHLRDLGLDGARPLLCLSTAAHQTLRAAGVPVRTT
ncbi:MULTISPECIES: hypothetical protein [Streptosporangium]|uniref:Fungal lipase-like domain-containing protein n=1 Tax=Streptosporangium brasiliense TaxID=47480 RepID=A0ABT9R6D2_9ACTN|nr:hypothetical protein [Streptosporangium brasiliense]MDP9864807.1 hypothetical protein [Streptosporangium brasiliense]